MPSAECLDAAAVAADFTPPVAADFTRPALADLDQVPLAVFTAQALLAVFARWPLEDFELLVLVEFDQ